jgi:iron(III) transport system substrate-binding protein
MKKSEKSLTTIGTVLLLSATMVSISACGTSTVSNTGNTSGSTSNTSSSTSSSGTSNNVGGTITLYTSEPVQDANLYKNAFEKEYPNVKVNIFSSGTTQVIAKLMAEKQAGNIKADVLLLADQPTFVQLKDQDMLLSYQSQEDSKIPSEFIDPDYDFVGTKALTTGIVYNTSLVKTAPADWSSLLDSTAKGKVIMPSPDFSGAAAYFAGVMSRTSGFGWDYFTSFKKNGVVVGSGNGSVLTAVENGQNAYGIIVDYMAVNASQKGSPVKFVYPTSGLPVITEPIGIVMSTQNKAGAEAFEDFVLSQAGQEAGVQMGYAPLRQGVTPPTGLKPGTDYKVLTVDPKTLADNRAQDIKKFDGIMK